MGDAYKLYEDGRSEISIKDYKYKPRVRQYESTRGGRQIISLLESNIGEYHAALHDIAAFRDDFSCIKVTGDWTSEEPLWANDWLPGLDSMYLYTLIRKKQPRIYFEVGSGNSTKFVRKAIKDGHLSTKIVSVDPSPRAEVDNICDIVIRKPFEDIDESVYLDMLTAGDVVFIDNSHRSFQSSDVTVFFTEMLPALPAGIIYGIHDIFIPFDYPQLFLPRCYNEQYLLLAYLLGGHGGDEVIFPGMYVSEGAAFSRSISEIFDSSPFQDIQRAAGAFWMRRTL